MKELGQLKFNGQEKDRGLKFMLKIGYNLMLK